VSGDDGPAAAYDITTGKRLWSLGDRCISPIGASPDGSRFFLNCNNDEGIEVVDSATGRTTVKFPDHGYILGFATDGRRVYLGTLDGRDIVALDAGSGRKVWSATFADDGPTTFSTGGGVVYGARGDGHPVAAFDAATGRALRLDATTSALFETPMIAKGNLYGVTGYKGAPRSALTAWTVA
jgi:outer membrane protein assembly factor BamB